MEEIEKYINDGCEFVLTVEHITTGDQWVVDCWKGEEYQEHHWTVRFNSEEAAMKEFNRWRA